MGSNRESYGSGKKKESKKGKIKIQKRKKSRLAVLKMYSDPANTIDAILTHFDWWLDYTDFFDWFIKIVSNRNVQIKGAYDLDTRVIVHISRKK